MVYEKDFYENGNVAGEGVGILANGKCLTGQFKTFYENGVLKSNICDTVLVAYESDGRMYLHATKVNGLKNGKSQYYLENKLCTVINYKNDKRDGLTIVYDIKTGGKILKKVTKVVCK